MKYCVLIIDGAAGLPLRERGGKTCLELARTPNLDAMAREGAVGLARTVPIGMEPSSACACMSILGYDPQVYYRGRAAIEAVSMDIPIDEGEVVFRCNLVSVRDGQMQDYSSGHISTAESRQLIAALNEKIGSESVHFYPGVSYRHLCKLAGVEETALAICTPPHDIPGQPIKGFLPKGQGSRVLRDLMKRSEEVLAQHPVNLERRARGETPATTLWLFWGSGRVPEMPAFKQVYGLNAALTSGVDLLQGLGKMVQMDVLSIPGVSDGPDNDYVAQISGALEALKKHDLVMVHIEAPDEAGHGGHIDEKVAAIEAADTEVVARLRDCRGDALRVLVMPDHPTPIEIRTHTETPVPFLMWGSGFASNGAKRLTEAEAQKSGLFIDPGYSIMGKLVS